MQRKCLFYEQKLPLKCFISVPYSTAFPLCIVDIFMLFLTLIEFNDNIVFTAGISQGMSENPEGCQKLEFNKTSKTWQKEVSMNVYHWWRLYSEFYVCSFSSILLDCDEIILILYIHLQTKLRTQIY